MLELLGYSIGGLAYLGLGAVLVYWLVAFRSNL
jgi:hypothetical protein